MQYPLDANPQYCYRNGMSKEVRGDPRGFVARVEQAREDRGLQVYEFSEAIGQAGSYWSSWMNRHRLRESFPRGDIMARMVDTLGVTNDYLLGRTPGAHESAPSRPAWMVKPRDVLLADLGAEKVSDLLFDMRAAADPDRRVPKSDRVRPRKPHYVIEVEGECMVPELHHGDIVHFDPDLQPENGDWVVATLDGGSATVKKLVVRGGVMQQLLPLNGEPLVIDENVRIVGVVLTYERPGPRGNRGRR